VLSRRTKAAFSLRQTRMSVASRQRREEMAHTRRAASLEKEREMLDRRARYTTRRWSCGSGRRRT
jgi:hypothetical protein